MKERLIAAWRALFGAPKPLVLNTEPTIVREACLHAVEQGLPERIAKRQEAEIARRAFECPTVREREIAREIAFKAEQWRGDKNLNASYVIEPILVAYRHELRGEKLENVA